MLLKVLIVYVREVHIVEFHAAQFLELFFDSTTHFQRQLQNLLQLFFCIFTIRIQQFDKATDHLADGNGISLIQIFAESEVMIKSIAILLLPQFSYELCKVIRNKSVVIREVFRTELWNLPAWNVAMHSVKKCCIRSHLRREWIKEAGRLQ